MADTTDVPGIGKLDKKEVFAGVGVLAALLGYAYWKRRQAQQSTTAVENVNDAVGATDFAVGGAANVAGATQDSTVTSSGLSGNKIITNGDWTQAATAYLSGMGSYQPGAVATALGKYLAHQGLTDDEINIVQAARGAFGDPPVGGPYALVHDTSTPASTGPLSHPPAAGAGSVGSFWYTTPSEMTWSDVFKATYGKVQIGVDNWTDLSLGVIRIQQANPGVDATRNVPAGTQLYIPLVGNGYPGDPTPGAQTLPPGATQNKPGT